MRWWPWGKTERRDSGGDFSDAVLRLIEATAAGTAANTTSTAAVEAAAGALSRAFAGAEVIGPGWVRDAVTPSVLGQIGRDLVRNGDSMHVLRMDRMGRVRLIAASSWHWEGNHDPDSWTVRVTAYGPSTSTTWNLPAASVVFVRWGSSPGQTYTGTAPSSWAGTTARLQAEIERSLADEAGGPLAQLLPIPQDPGEGVEDDTDPLADLRADIQAARGAARLVETTAGGWGDGRVAAPQRDWAARRLGPQPPAEVVKLANDSFDRMLAACGYSPALVSLADGTSQRESLRRWHLGTVLPLARMLEHELTAKLETDVSLRFDQYGSDLVSRAQTVDKLVRAGVALPTALEAVGLDSE